MMVEKIQMETAYLILLIVLVQLVRLVPLVLQARKVHKATLEPLVLKAQLV